MRQVDFSPFYRSTVGFDHLFNNWFDSRTQPDDISSYPPYNIERLTEDSYRISMAVAGFSQNEIDIEMHRNLLVIKGEKISENDDEKREFLYRGIASRAFERRFHLADHVKVTGAELCDGLLHIQLKREMPAELKPKKIAIHASPYVVKNSKEQNVCAESLEIEKA
ncbi:Hsp20 family protein [Bartonella sp. B41]